MANIFSGSKINNILKEEKYLYPDFIPERILFRDSEIDEMVFCLKPAASGKKPTNLFLTGVPGTGKTACSKYVLGELLEFSDRVKTVYINCFENSSLGSILVKLTNSFGYPVPSRGFSNEEIFERLVAVIKNKKIIPIIVFDEAEQLLKKEDTKKMLYDLSRLKEQSGLIIGMAFISNDISFLSFLDDRVRSSINASKIVFEKYTSLQLKEILKERAKFAFFANTFDDNVIPLVAAHASKLGDARVAIDLLLRSARLAERENSKIINVSHVRKSFVDEKPIKIELSSNLSNQEKQILDLISVNELTAGQIYEKLNKNFSERTLRNAISNLESKNLVCAKKIRQGRGFTRLICKKT